MQDRIVAAVFATLRALPMKNLSISILGTLAIALTLVCVPFAAGQEGQEAATESGGNLVKAPVVGRAFSATKYAKLVSVLPDGKRHFIRNERYPTRVARAADGRIMMQSFGDDVSSECDRPTMRIPPPCPYWNVFVIDLSSHLVTHWSDGEFAAQIAVDFPLSQERLELAARLTSEMPNLGPDPDTDATKMSKEDLGDRVIDGIRARGVRTTITYPVGHSGSKVPTALIHELWIAPEMNLIVRVIDGDPHGLERIWGLEKISLQPDPSLFLPPHGYGMQHQKSDWGAYHDFEELESWFEK
jgi:hypothetical protein